MIGNIAIFENLSRAIKEDEELFEPLKTSITHIAHLWKMSLNDILLSLNKMKLHLYEIRCRLL